MKGWLVCLMVLGSLCAVAADWPQWRCDAHHSAYTPLALPAELSHQWARSFAPRQQAWPSPLNQYLMQYDRQFEPVVMDGVMVLAFNEADQVIGIDVVSGKTLWTFFTGGPIRLAPALWKGKAYISCDDGFVYCLHVADGSEVWRFDAAPDRRQVVGNRRVISMWPVRGGAVVERGRLYFSAGIWPFMGVFIYCLDADTGHPIWVNDYSDVTYRNQPHHSPAFAGMAPQGVFSVTEKYVLAAGGRTIPGAFNKRTGKEAYYLFSQNSKNHGGDFVAVGEDYHYARARNSQGQPVYQAWENATGALVKEVVFEGAPVLGDGFVFSSTNGLESIVAGRTAYIGGDGFVEAVDVATTNTLWKKEVDGTVVRLLAASDRLFAVTLEGAIHCFGSEKPSPVPSHEVVPLLLSPAAHTLAEQLRTQAPLDSGYALIWGIGDGQALAALATESDYSILCVDSSASAVAAWRKKLNAAGLYGDKVSVQYAPDGIFDVPQYIMSLVVVNDSTDQDLWKAVRPYGGMMRREGVSRIREGALEGSADWTHNLADVGQSAKSDDLLVKTPLAPLWWGGEAPNTDVLPRHGHGPGQLVVGGRLLIQGLDGLSARDVYTGRLLWRRDIPGLNRSGLFFNKTYNPDPMAVGYNQIHLPGVNTRGANYAATSDRIYLLKGVECLVLDPASGETLDTFSLPGGEEWGYIGVAGDQLIAGGGFVELSPLAQDPEELSAKATVFASSSFDHSSSKRLYGLDRRSGQSLWMLESKYGFLHNAICASSQSLFCIDRYPYYIEQHLRRRGEDPPENRYVLRALDLASGSEKWTVSNEVFGTFLAYSKTHDALVMAYRVSRDGPAQPKHGRIAVRVASTGELCWDKAVDYREFPITHNDYLFTRSGAWRITDGAPLAFTDPMTGITGVWDGYSVGYGCNYPVASEHLLTYRSSTASFYDLRSLGGTGSLGGFKSGCSATLIAANGVLSAPDYTFTCSCAFQTQASLALIHDEDVDHWTAYDARVPDGAIQHYALNLGAPGDRRDGSTVWFNLPNVDQATPTVPVRFSADAKWTAHHSLRFAPRALRWVYASCLEEATSFEMALGGTDLPAPKKSAKKKKKKAAVELAAPIPAIESVDPFSRADLSGTFTVRLYFAEPDDLAPGDRVFDVVLNGETVLPALDVCQAAGGPRRGIMKEFRGISCVGSLKVDFAAATKRGAILSGIELIRE